MENVQNCKILPVKYPLITSFPSYANVLSVALQDDESLPWFYTNFIQMKGFSHDNQSIFIRFEKCECPFTHNRVLDRDYFSNNWKSIVKFCISHINSGYYVTLFVDRYYLPIFDGYKKIHSTHPTLIYGYNIEKESFNIADFYKNNRYMHTKSSFDAIEAAFNNLKTKSSLLRHSATTKITDIILEKYKKSSFEFDLKFVMAQIKDYLSCRSSAYNYEPKIFGSRKEYKYGLDTYKILVDYLDSIETKDKADIRAFHILLDHKKVMIARLHYIKNIGHMNNASQIIDSYQTIAKTAKMIRNLLIKYNITFNRSLLLKCQKYLFEIAEMEKTALTKMLQSVDY